MEAINYAIEGADAFRKMMDKIEDQNTQATTNSPNFQNRSLDHEGRKERRERERFEAKQASRIARGLA